MDQAVDLKEEGATTRPSQRLLGQRPLLYFCGLVLVMLAAFAFHVGRNGVFACPAGPYADHFIAYCESTDFGDYEHGALWYGLEPDTTAALVNADVIFLGNSRVQFGFSGPTLQAWFDRLGARYYMLGFGYGQNSAFVGPLLDRLQPKARMYIVNADSYFREKAVGPGPAVMAGGESRRYFFKKLWQGPHWALCGLAPALCGQWRAFYRDRQTGEWIHAGVAANIPYPRIDVPANLEEVALYAPIAERFVADLPVPKDCVLFTFVWTPTMETETARALAAEIGVPFVAPEVGELQTFDGSHIDAPSVEIWVNAFAEVAEPHIRRCLALDAPAAAAAD